LKWYRYAKAGPDRERERRREGGMLDDKGRGIEDIVGAQWN
jgi:hypothetical protein